MFVFVDMQTSVVAAPIVVATAVVTVDAATPVPVFSSFGGSDSGGRAT